MAIFTSAKTPVDISAEALYDRLSNLDNIKDFLANAPKDKIPEDKRDLYDGIKVTSDSIAFPAGPIGEIRLRLARCVRPSLISLQGVDTPVALTMSLSIEPTGPSSCEGEVSVDIAIPAMLKPMVAAPIQNAVDQTSRLLTVISSHK